MGPWKCEAVGSRVSAAAIDVVVQFAGEIVVHSLRERIFIARSVMTTLILYRYRN